MFIKLFFLCILVCFLIVQMALLNNMKKVYLETFCIAACNTVVFIAVFSNFLSVLGYFNLFNIAILLLITCGIFLILFKCNIKEYLKGKKTFNISSGLILLGLLFIFCLYTLFKIIPFGMGRDPSVYFYEGIHIAEKGNIFFQGDSFIAQNYNKIRNIIDDSYAGLYSAVTYGISETHGDIIVQFLHMFPSILAVGYSLGGVSGLLLVNPTIATLSAFIIYIYLERVFGNKKISYIAFILCALNPAQIYSARITQSELLCQLIFMLSIYYFAVGWERKKYWIISLSGILLGLLTFIRIDMYILGIGIYVLSIYFIFVNKINTKKILCYCCSYTIMGILSFLYGLRYSYPYYKDHWDLGVLFYIIIINIVLFCVVLLFAFIRLVFIKSAYVCDIIDYISNNKILLKVFISALVIVFLIAYFIRPIIYEKLGYIDRAQSFKANAMVEFCFYTSFVALLLGIYGIYYIIKKSSLSLIHSILPLAFLGMSNLVVYIYNPSIAGDQIWASRRWITICIPFVLILAAIGISKISIKKHTNLVQAFIIVYIVLFMIFQSKSFIFQNIGGNILNEYKQYFKLIDDDKIYISKDKMFVTILREIGEKKNVYRASSEFDDSIEDYIKEYGAINYIGTLSKELADNTKISIKKIANYKLYSNELERVFGKMPEKIVDKIVISDIYQLTYAEYDDGLSLFDESKSQVEIYDLERFSGQNWITDERDIISNGSSGYVLYGPYDTLEKGTYEVDINFELDMININNIEIGFFEVVGPNQILINKTPVFCNNKIENISLPFSLNDTTNSIEFRFYVNEGVIAKINELKIKQISDLFCSEYNIESMISK